MNTKTKHWAGITAGILSLSGYASATSLGSEKYTYDASGNIVEKSIDRQVTKMTYDSSNRLTERQATGQSKETTAYDAAGRPIAMKDGTGQPTRSMSYGYGDKALETKNHGANTGFYYNADGQLVGKKTDSGVATYTWDGNVLAADGNQAFTNEAHVSGGVPLLESENEIVVSDHLGNTLASGERNFNSTAFGEGLEEGRFTGKPYMKELGKFSFRFRNYDATQGRWTTADPLGFPDGRNNLTYLTNPTAGVDPLGTEVVLWRKGEEVSSDTQTRAAHSYGSIGAGRAFGSYADYDESSVSGTSGGFNISISGSGMSAFPDLFTDSVSVTPSVSVFENPDGTLSFNEEGDEDDFEDGDAPLKAGASATVTGEGTKTMTFVIRGATALNGGGLSGVGVGPASVSWSSGVDAKTFPLGTWTYKEK